MGNSNNKVSVTARNLIAYYKIVYSMNGTNNKHNYKELIGNLEGFHDEIKNKLIRICMSGKLEEYINLLEKEGIQDKYITTSEELLNAIISGNLGLVDYLYSRNKILSDCIKEMKIRKQNGEKIKKKDKYMTKMRVESFDIDNIWYLEESIKRHKDTKIFEWIKYNFKEDLELMAGHLFKYSYQHKYDIFTDWFLEKYGDKLINKEVFEKVCMWKEFRVAKYIQEKGQFDDNFLCEFLWENCNGGYTEIVKFLLDTYSEIYNKISKKDIKILINNVEDEIKYMKKIKYDNDWGLFREAKYKPELNELVIENGGTIIEMLLSHFRMNRIELRSNIEVSEYLRLINKEIIRIGELKERNRSASIKELITQINLMEPIKIEEQLDSDSIWKNIRKPRKDIFWELTTKNIMAR